VAVTRITQQQLESYLWGAAVLLRGTIDAGDYKQFIFPLLFYKRLCDVFDEETAAALAESRGDQAFAAYPENHRFQIPRDAHWSEVRKVATHVGQALATALRAIETANPDKLYGIFGDAQWTNKDRLSDAMLRDLIEHFSRLDLTVANLPEDELGQGYEYLIKKFADDAGHTAAEFYTNRTVVHLMTEMLQPLPGQSVYDPTCGSGGMLLSTIAHLRRQGKEWRNVRLFGQERNLMTSSIARMNCFLHGIEDFRIERGDTLSEPRLVQGDRLMQFDVVLANPPYSIKQWDQAAFASDPWGRNVFGTPPQGRADYAFWQHILASLDPRTGRCAILFPHGVLFRQEEAEMRKKLIEADLIECVLGLGPNLFYNSPMEACVVVCRARKPKERRGRILFINAVNEVARERAQSFLKDEHIARILEAYRTFHDDNGFARVVDAQEIRKNDGNLSISMYVGTGGTANGESRSDLGASVASALDEWLSSREAIGSALANVLGGDFRPSETAVVNARDGALSLLDRCAWKRLPFGAFADSVNDRVEPGDAGNDIYVGLEHLDAHDLHVRRWGKASDVIGTKLRFRKGDIIFGRRRAYQRKLAVAEFDGICSAHAMVVRAKPEVVLPEFLPFLMISDRFMNRAVDISVGSLSPTINWTTLKREEFDLPPMDQQRRVAEMLKAVDESIGRVLCLRDMASATACAVRDDHFRSEQYRGSVPVRDVGEWFSGNTPARSDHAYWCGDFPWVSPKDMKSTSIVDSEEHLSESGKAVASCVKAGTLLMVIRGMILAHSFPVGIAQREVAFNQDIKALVPTKAYSDRYLLQWFTWATPKILARISDSSHGTKRLAMDDLFSMRVPSTSVDSQRFLVARIESIDALAEAASRMLAVQMQLRASIVSKTVGVV
jgi:type I restriction enzyme M protein